MLMQTAKPPDAVHPPTEHIPVPVIDWFLDRSKTPINVMGDLSVMCLLYGQDQEAGAVEPV